MSFIMGSIAIIALILLAMGGRSGGGGNAPAIDETPPDGGDDAGRPESDDGEGGWMLPPTSSEPMSHEALRQLVRDLGYDARWADFMVAVAWGESRLVPDAINGGDAPAAATGYERNKSWLADCGIPADRYKVGAVGLYQLLPSSGMRAFKGSPYRCMDPVEALQAPVISTIAALAYARRVMGWSDWGRSDKTWGALRRGWRAPGLTDGSAPATDARFRDALKAVGLPASFANQKVTPRPSGWSAVDQVARYVEVPGGA